MAERREVEEGAWHDRRLEGVKVLDFGLAAQVRSSLSRTSQAVTSKSGTPGYKAPEQWRGQPQGPAADQYALGVLAYKMFAGFLPFDGDGRDGARPSQYGNLILFVRPREPGVR